MSGTPIRIRRTLQDTPVDTPSTGEPFLHMEDNKFGIFNGTTMLWYPGLDPLTKTMYMNLDQALSGKDSNGNSTVYISFDTPNAITFLTSTGDVLAQFDSTGASFNNLAELEPVGGGALNRLTHPGFIPNVFSSSFTAINNTPSTRKWLGPNTLMFMATGGMGHFTCYQGYIAGSSVETHIASERFTLAVDVHANLGNSGLRIWAMDPNMGYFQTSTKNKNRFYISVKGELGKSCYLRVGRNGTYAYKSIIGTGSWRREFIDIPQHSYTSDFIQGGVNAPYAIDVLYNADAGFWGIAEPTIQCLDNFSDEIYQYRSIAERMNMANMLWYEPVGFRMYGTETEYVNVPIPLPVYSEGYCFYSVETVVSTYPPTISNKTRRGFEVKTTTANTSYWKYQPRIVMHGQISDIA